MVLNWLAFSLASVAAAQYFPPTPEGLKIVKSKHEEGVVISFKEVGLWLHSIVNSIYLLRKARDL